MIGLDVQIDRRSERFLDEMAKTYPAQVRQAFSRACSIVCRRMRGAMADRPRKGAVVTVAKWDAFTRKERERSSLEYRHTFGGKLVWPKKKQIAIVPEGRDRVRVGWVGALEDWAVRFQEGGSRETSPTWRHWLYRKGFTETEVPKVANTPPRPIVEPTAEDGVKHIADWTLGAFASLMRRKAQKLELSANADTREGMMAAARRADEMRGIA